MTLRTAFRLLMAASALLAGVAVATPAGGEVTFHRDIAPIMRRECAGFHFAGGPTPFPLLTAADARKREIACSQGG